MDEFNYLNKIIDVRYLSYSLFEQIILTAVLS